MDQAPTSAISGSRLSLRAKLTLWYVAIFLVIKLTVLAVALFYYQQWLDRLFNERLDLWATVLISRLGANERPMEDGALREAAQVAFASSFNEPLTLVIYDESGGVLASTRRPAPSAQATRAAIALREHKPLAFRAEVEGLTVDDGTDPKVRVAVRPLRLPNGSQGALIVSRPDVTYESMVSAFTRLLLYTTPAGVIGAAIAGWLVSGLTLAPLAHLRRIAGSLSPEKIEQEPEPPGHLSRELAQLEAELIATRAKLLQAFRAQERFISSVSHELKTPISVLLTEGQTLRTDSLPEEARVYVRSVTDEIRRLGRMVESFLMLAHLRGGRDLESGRSCPINDIAMEAVSDCRKMANQYSVSLRPSLDDADPPPTVLGEPELLRVMVDNLLRNAIRFSPVHSCVIVKVRSSAGFATIAVRDFGPGVPGEMIDRIFDRFVQAPDETQRARGYGLGLSIAQGIAELHSGSITVQNLPDGGCEFCVRLPVAGVGHASVGPAENKHGTQSGAQNGSTAAVG